MRAASTPPGTGSRGDARAHVGRYELLFRVAAGGMAEVFAGRVRGEAGFEKLVAIKRMLPHLADDPRFVDMFLDEARVAANISSPHVVQTLDLGRDDGGALFLVLELCVGASLAALLRACDRRGERVPLPIAIEILAQAAEGLDDAHEATTPTGEALGIVHRDVSPHNLLVGVDGRTRVADFGIARALYRRSHTSTGELKGKFAYFSPEQARGEDVDRRSDVFALGIVAWEAVTGAKLFGGDDALKTLRRVAEDPIPDPRTRRGDLPGAVAGVVLRALLRDPADRWQTAGEMATALRHAAQSIGPAPAPRALGRWVADVGGERVRAIREGIDGALGADAIPVEIDPEPPTQVASGVRPGTGSGAAAAVSAPPTDVASTPSAAGPPLPAMAPPPKPRLLLESAPSVTETDRAVVMPAPAGATPARAIVIGAVAALVVAGVFLAGRMSREQAPAASSAVVSAEPVAAATAIASASSSAAPAPPASATAAPAAASASAAPRAPAKPAPSATPAASAPTATATPAAATPAATAVAAVAPPDPPPAPKPAPAPTADPAPKPTGPLLGDDAFNRDLSRKH